MTISPHISHTHSPIPADIHDSCELVQVLMKLQRAAQLITSTLDLDQLVDRVVNDLASTVGCVEVSVWLRDSDTEEMVLQGVRGCTQNEKGCRLKIGSEGMVGHVAASGRMRYAPDVRLDPFYIGCEPDTLSAVNIPLFAGGHVIGVLGVDHTETDAFSSDQLHVLQALAGHIAVAVENARLYQLEREARKSMEREAEEARSLQQVLFSKPIPLIPHFAFETAWHPARIVAGDWFDVIDLGSEQYAVVLADVSGKGMPAALLMSATRAILRSIAKLHHSPGDVLSELNETLLKDFPVGKFVTMIYGVLDASSREVTLASAGHPRPMLINGECSFLELDTGLPLGLQTSSYPELRVKLEAGTRLLMYTDGITEAMSRHDEEYGPARLMEHFQQPDACIDGLIEEIRHFCRGSAEADDATAVLIRSR
jgi:sigma-B regulation protein RsbU (phosphoserine phosphatase)